MVINRFDVFWINLNPTVGCEVKKNRPCVVVSPQEINETMRTVIIAPLTTTISKYPMRIETNLNNTKCEIMLDQLRAVDKSRLIKKETHLRGVIQDTICNTLVEMFCKRV